MCLLNPCLGVSKFYPIQVALLSDRKPYPIQDIANIPATVLTTRAEQFVKIGQNARCCNFNFSISIAVLNFPFYKKLHHKVTLVVPVSHLK